MTIPDEAATIALSLIGGGVTAGIAWGVSQATISNVKDKMADLQKNFDNHVEDDKEIHSRFVTTEVFTSVINPIHSQLQSIQSDIKDLIKLVSKAQTRRE